MCLLTVDDVFWYICVGVELLLSISQPVVGGTTVRKGNYTRCGWELLAWPSLLYFYKKCVFPIISNGLIAFFMIRSDALFSRNMFELNGIAYFMVKLNWIYIERALTKVIFTSWHQMGKIKRGNFAFYIINFPNYLPLLIVGQLTDLSAITVSVSSN